MSTLTNAQKQKKFRQAMREQGYSQLYCWLSAKDKQAIIDFAKDRGQTVERALVDAIEEARAYRAYAENLLFRAKHM